MNLKQMVKSFSNFFFVVFISHFIESTSSETNLTYVKNFIFLTKITVMKKKMESNNKVE